MGMYKRIFLMKFLLNKNIIKGKIAQKNTSLSLDYSTLQKIMKMYGNNIYNTNYHNKVCHVFLLCLILMQSTKTLI